MRAIPPALCSPQARLLRPAAGASLSGRCADQARLPQAGAQGAHGRRQQRRQRRRAGACGSVSLPVMLGALCVPGQPRSARPPSAGRHPPPCLLRLLPPLQMHPDKVQGSEEEKKEAAKKFADVSHGAPGRRPARLPCAAAAAAAAAPAAARLLGRGALPWPPVRGAARAPRRLPGRPPLRGGSRSRCRAAQRCARCLGAAAHEVLADPMERRVEGPPLNTARPIAGPADPQRTRS